MYIFVGSIDTRKPELRLRSKNNSTTIVNDDSENVQDEKIVQRKGNVEKGEKKMLKLVTEKGNVHTNSVWLHRLSLVFGFLVMLLAGYIVALNLRTVHENYLWFSNIKASHGCCLSRGQLT